MEESDSQKRGVSVNRIEILEKLRDFAAEGMKNNDPSHDFSHTQRVVSLSLRLADELPRADLFLTEAIALLHDVCDDKLAFYNAADGIEKLLQKLEVPKDEQKFILDGIGSVSFRKQPKQPKDAPIEVQIVQDADRIDAIGAVGVARAFAFSGHKGYPVGTAEPGSTIRHFEEKLLLLYDLLNTEAAKKLAARRAEFLQLFYREFLTEIGEGLWKNSSNTFWPEFLCWPAPFYPIFTL